MKKREKSLVPDICFYVALMIELMIVILDKSAYIIHYEGQWFRLTFCLFGVKALFNRYTWKEWLGFVTVGVVGVISYYVTGRNEMLRIIMLVAACKGMKSDRVLKTIFWTTLAGCTVLVLLSLTGIMGLVSITAEFRVGRVETRYCFGMGHPNAFHCMVWALVTLGCYIYRNKLKLWHYALLFVGNIVIYMFSLSRTAVIVTAVVIILFAMVCCCKQIADRRLFYVGCALTIVACVIMTVVLCETLEYSALVQKIDEKLSLRIWVISVVENAMPHDWTLFGLPENIEYFDMGIVRLFYWYGWIPACIYFAVNFSLIIVAYKKKDASLAVLVTTFMMYTVIEAHLISDYLLRNYLFVLYGLALTTSKADKDRPAEYALWDIRRIRRGVKCE